MCDVDGIGDYYLSSIAEEFETESENGDSSFKTITCDISKNRRFYCEATFRLFEFNIKRLKVEFERLSSIPSTDKEVEDFLDIGIVSDAFCSIQLLHPNKKIIINFDSEKDLEVERDLVILLNWHWNHLRYRDAREILKCISNEINF